MSPGPPGDPTHRSCPTPAPPAQASVKYGKDPAMQGGQGGVSTAPLTARPPPKNAGGQSQPCSPRLWDFGTCVQAAVGARGAQLAQRAFSHPAGVWPARSLSSIAAAVQEHEALGVQDAAQPGAHPHSQANPGLRVSSALGPCWGTDTHLSSRATGAGAGSGWCSWRSAAPGPRS